MASFTHLHVPGAFGVHGDPAEAVGAAAADGATAAAWTDRDGLWKAVRHIGACLDRGLDPVVGVDLAVLSEHDAGPSHPDGRSPRRGTAGEAGRVVVLAHGGNRGRGWAALCRVVSDAHAHARARAVPVGVLREELAARCLDPDTGRPVLTVLLGPDSDVGRSVGGDRFLRPRTLFREWLDAMPAGVVAVELATHRNQRGETDLRHAVRMLRLAAEHGIPAVLTAPVQALGGARADDAALSPAAVRGGLVPAALMRAHGAEIIQAAGMRGSDLANLLSNTERIADRCRLDSATDLGWDRPLLAPREAAAAVAEAVTAIQGLGVRCAAVRGEAPSIEVEDHELGRVYRGLVAHFGPDRAALAGTWGGADGGMAGRPGRVERRAPAVQLDLLTEPATASAAKRPLALRPCGIVIGDTRLRDRAPVQPSGAGAHMVQVDQGDARRLGLAVIDVHGSQEQSAIAFAMGEVARFYGTHTAPEDPDGHAAWLAVEHPEALLAGSLEHPGQRHDEPPAVRAARAGVPLLPVDLGASGPSYRLERITSGPDTGRVGIRTPLTAVGGLSRREVARIVAAQPFASVADARDRAGLTRAAVRRLVDAGAFSSLHRAAAARGSMARLAADMAELARGQVTGAPGPITGQLAFGVEVSVPPEAG